MPITIQKWWYQTEGTEVVNGNKLEPDKFGINSTRLK